MAITKEDDFFIARCPELNVTSQGETLEEAEMNIKETIDFTSRTLELKTFRYKFLNLIDSSGSCSCLNYSFIWEGTCKCIKEGWILIVRQKGPYITPENNY
jgi:hypothetical protein